MDDDRAPPPTLGNDASSVGDDNAPPRSCKWSKFTCLAFLFILMVARQLHQGLQIVNYSHYNERIRHDGIKARDSSVLAKIQAQGGDKRKRQQEKLKIRERINVNGVLGPGRKAKVGPLVSVTGGLPFNIQKPIIVVGFPKAGTSSIFGFFHCNGLRSQHWYCCGKQNHPARSTNLTLMSKCMIGNLISKSPILQGCGDFDVYTEINGPRHNNRVGSTILDDGTVLPNQTRYLNQRLFFPQHHRLQEIHEQYPNATFILNLRPAEAWVSSVVRWKAMLEYEILNEFFNQETTRFLFSDIADSKANPNTTSPFRGRNVTKDLIMVFNYHTQYIREFVAKNPSHALIEVDVTSNTAGQVLAGALGLREDCWGHFNKNAKESKVRNNGRNANMASAQRISRRYTQGQFATAKETRVSAAFPSAMRRKGLRVQEGGNEKRR